MDSGVYQIMYVSSAAKDHTETDMCHLCGRIQKRNEERGISGILLYAEGNIIQVLEGPEAIVCELFGKVSRDLRHTGIAVLSRKHMEKRDFPDFGMGFIGTGKQTISEFENLFQSKHDFPQDRLEGVSKQVKVFLKTFLKTTQVTS